MKNITPVPMRCDSFQCPSIHELEDGRLLIIGEYLSTNEAREAGANPNPETEGAIIIDRALLATIRDEVREECALIADRAASDSKARDTMADDFGVYAAMEIVAAIRALKEMPHE